MAKILGFDISSTCIGYCVLEIDQSSKCIKLVDSGFIKPIKTGNIIERIVDTRDKIKEIIEKANPDYIGIEDIIQFMQGRSTSQTITTLTAFNRMICLLSYDFLHRTPELFNVMSIRHGLKTTKVLPKKEEIPELVAKHLGITFPYFVDRKGRIKKENYDMADGFAVALYYAFKILGKLKSSK